MTTLLVLWCLANTIATVILAKLIWVVLGHLRPKEGWQRPVVRRSRESQTYWDGVTPRPKPPNELTQLLEEE